MASLPHWFLTATLLAPLAADTPRDHDSLQDLLGRLRARRDGVVTELRGTVDALVATLDAEAVPRNLDALDAAKDKLIGLGQECGPLLLDYLDPGVKSTDAQKLRSQYVTLALVGLKSKAITTKLIEMAQNASPDGRANAIQVLATSPEPERVAPVLIGLFRGSQGDLRIQALTALAKLGGDSSDKVLDEGLNDTRPEIVDATLEALAQAKKASIAPRVIRLLASPAQAVGHLEKLMAYYRAVPEGIDKAGVMAWVRVAEDLAATNEQRLKVLEFLPTFADRFDAESRRELRTLAESPTPEVAQGALIALVLVGDRSARKELLAPLDDEIENNKTWPALYTSRGDVLYKIADYKDAINDYKKAIQLAADDLRARQDGAYIGLARCYAMTNKLKEAGTTLERAPLTAKQLVALRRDPAFAKLVEHPKYKDLFNPK